MSKEQDKTPFVSVIIPTYNDNEGLVKCLTALDSQSYPEDRYEIIVVDNGSIESPESIVKSVDNAILLHESKPSSYAARNLGIQKARGEILAFIDSDCIADSHWIENGVNQLVDATEPTVVGGEVDVFCQDESHPTWVELYEKMYAFPIEQNIAVKHYPPSGNMFVKKTDLMLVGDFNSDLKSGGDRDWGNRAYAKGLHILYSDAIRVLHPARRTFTEHASKIKRVAGGEVERALQDSRPILLNRLFYRDFFPPVTAIRKLVQADGFTLSEKCKILAVLLRSRTVTVREKLSIILFGKDTDR